jgi:hypothetical protein
MSPDAAASADRDLRRLPGALDRLDVGDALAACMLMADLRERLADCAEDLSVDLEPLICAVEAADVLDRGGLVRRLRRELAGRLAARTGPRGLAA